MGKDKKVKKNERGGALSKKEESERESLSNQEPCDTTELGRQLLFALSTQDFKLAQECLVAKQAPVNIGAQQVDNGEWCGLTPLWLALDPTQKPGRFETITLLLDVGANPNVKNEVHGYPLLFVLQQTSTNRNGADIPLAMLLLDYGADPNVVTQDGTTALMIAAGLRGSNPKSFKSLVEKMVVKGANPFARDASHNTALHYAVKCGEPSIDTSVFLASFGLDPLDLHPVTGVAQSPVPPIAFASLASKRKLYQAHASWREHNPGKRSGGLKDESDDSAPTATSTTTTMTASTTPRVESTSSLDVQHATTNLIATLTTNLQIRTAEVEAAKIQLREDRATMEGRMKRMVERLNTMEAELGEYKRRMKDEVGRSS